MNKTSLGEEGVLAIANALKSGNSKLTSLSVSGNQVGNKTAIAFGELFESNHTLKVLDLSWNSIKVSETACSVQNLYDTSQKQENQIDIAGRWCKASCSWSHEQCDFASTRSVMEWTRECRGHGIWRNALYESWHKDS